VEGSGAIEFVGEEGRGTLTFSIIVGFLAWNKSLNVRGSHLERKYIGKLKKKKKPKKGRYRINEEGKLLFGDAKNFPFLSSSFPLPFFCFSFLLTSRINRVKKNYFFFTNVVLIFFK
jgi:hypothetical protein